MKKQSNPPFTAKKLSLGKKTISNLDASEMQQKVGGQFTTFCHGGHTVNCTRQKTCADHKTCQYTCI